MVTSDSSVTKLPFPRMLLTCNNVFNEARLFPSESDHSSERYDHYWILSVGRVKNWPPFTLINNSSWLLSLRVWKSLYILTVLLTSSKKLRAIYLEMTEDLFRPFKETVFSFFVLFYREKGWSLHRGLLTSYPLLGKPKLLWSFKMLIFWKCIYFNPDKIFFIHNSFTSPVARMCLLVSFVRCH